MEQDGELTFGDVAVGTAAKTVLTLENTSATPAVYEVCSLSLSVSLWILLLT
jgi:hypothetical protein